VTYLEEDRRPTVAHADKQPLLAIRDRKPEQCKPGHRDPLGNMGRRVLALDLARGHCRLPHQRDGRLHLGRWIAVADKAILVAHVFDDETRAFAEKYGIETFELKV
jgi:hypothetical protein